MSDLEERIRARAYQLWEQAGRPDQGSESYWYAARRELEGDVPPVGDAPGGAIDAPPDEQTLEEPPEAAVQQGVPTGMPGERISEQGVPDERLLDMANPRPAEPAAAEAAVPARPVRAAAAPARKPARRK